MTRSLTDAKPDHLPSAEDASHQATTTLWREAQAAYLTRFRPSRRQNGSNTCPIQAVIFDCDGVLVDSEVNHAQAWITAFKSVGMHFTESDYMKYIGFDDFYLVNHHILSSSQEMKDQLVAAKLDAYAVLQENPVVPMQRGVQLARYLYSNRESYGIKIGLASSSSRNEILESLKGVGLEEMFDCIVSGIDDLHHYHDDEGVNKPKPYIYREMANQLGILPENCVVFEDTPAGVDAASSASMTVCALPNAWTVHLEFSNAHIVLR